MSKDAISTCILKNRAVIGEKTKRGVVCYPFPAIITPEQFERVQGAKENRRLNRTFTSPTDKTVNLFQGVIRCGHCGGRMDVITRRRTVGTTKWAKGGEKIEDKDCWERFRATSDNFVGPRRVQGTACPPLLS